MRKWPSVPPQFGVVELFYDLPEYTDLGNWTIRVQASGQIENKVILVEKYFRTLHEVHKIFKSFAKPSLSICPVAVLIDLVIYFKI